MISGPFALIGLAWEFIRKQPALKGVGFALVFVPMLAMDALVRFLPALSEDTKNAALIIALGIFLLSLLMLWGSACVLLVGKRLLSSAAGRSRTSFKAVRSQAAGFVFPLLITDLLRTGMTILWALPALAIVIFALATNRTAGLEGAYHILALASLFLIPAIIYSVRTVFASVVVVTEGLMYRPALRRSQEVVRGRLPRVLFTLLGINLVLFLPPQALQAGLEMVTNVIPSQASLLVMEVGTLMIIAVQSLSVILSSIASILLFGELVERSEKD